MFNYVNCKTSNLVSACKAAPTLISTSYSWWNSDDQTTYPGAVGFVLISPMFRFHILWCFRGESSAYYRRVKRKCQLPLLCAFAVYGRRVTLCFGVKLAAGKEFCFPISVLQNVFKTTWLPPYHVSKCSAQFFERLIWMLQSCPQPKQIMWGF